MKTEYRSAFYNAKTQDILTDVGNLPIGHEHPRQQLEPDDLDLAGLPLQLDRSGRREVLI